MIIIALLSFVYQSIPAVYVSCEIKKKYQNNDKNNVNICTKSEASKLRIRNDINEIESE